MMKKFLTLILVLAPLLLLSQTKQDDCTPEYRNIVHNPDPTVKNCTELKTVNVVKYYVRIATMKTIFTDRRTFQTHNIKAKSGCLGFPPGTIRHRASEETGLDPLVFDIIRTPYTESFTKAEQWLKFYKGEGYIGAGIETIKETYHIYR